MALFEIISPELYTAIEGRLPSAMAFDVSWTFPVAAPVVVYIEGIPAWRLSPSASPGTVVVSETLAKATLAQLVIEEPCPPVEECSRSVYGRRLKGAEDWIAAMPPVPMASALRGRRGDLEVALGIIEGLVRGWRIEEDDAYRLFLVHVGAQALDTAEARELFALAKARGVYACGSLCDAHEAEHVEQEAARLRSEAAKARVAEQAARLDERTWLERGLDGWTCQVGVPRPTGAPNAGIGEPSFVHAGKEYFCFQALNGYRRPSGAVIGAGLANLAADEVVPLPKALVARMQARTLSAYEFSEAVAQRVAHGCFDSEPVPPRLALDYRTPIGRAAIKALEARLASGNQAHWTTPGGGMSVLGPNDALRKLDVDFGCRWLCIAPDIVSDLISKVVPAARTFEHNVWGTQTVAPPFERSTIDIWCQASSRGELLGMKAAGGLDALIVDGDEKPISDPFGPIILAFVLDRNEVSTPELMAELKAKGMQPDEGNPKTHARVKKILGPEWEKREVGRSEDGKRQRSYCRLKRLTLPTVAGVIADYETEATPADKAMQQTMGRMAVEGRLAGCGKSLSGDRQVDRGVI